MKQCAAITRLNDSNISGSIFFNPNQGQIAHFQFKQYQPTW